MTQPDTNRFRHPSRHHATVSLAGLMVAYFLTAYLLLPLGWRHEEHKHPLWGNVPGVTRTANGIPGDPLNLMLVGSEQQLQSAMIAAGWTQATKLNLESSVDIAADTLLDRKFAAAPVSALYLWNRVEDLAFERPVGNSPSRRHHVRFWRVPPTFNSQTAWVGAATYDRSVGLSHTTGQITHHIGEQIDADRDLVMQSLVDSGELSEIRWVENFHTFREGRNGGGDRYETDGRLAWGELLTKTP